MTKSRSKRLLRIIKHLDVLMVIEEKMEERENPSNSCEYKSNISTSLWCYDNQRITVFIKYHPQSPTKVCRRVHGNPSHSSRDILVQYGPTLSSIETHDRWTFYTHVFTHSPAQEPARCLSLPAVQHIQ